MKTWTLAMALIGLMTVACEEERESMIEGSDKSFLFEAGAANQAELEYARLAAVKGTSEAVRAFGQQTMMAKQQAINDLKRIADNDHIFLNTAMDEAHQQQFARLGTFVGMQFDTCYLNCQMKCQRESIALYEAELEQGKVEVVKNHVSTFLPSMKSRVVTAGDLSVRANAEIAVKENN
ncbi:DUF4142 domain-containing protein [Chryseolinea lacunae]|uniref:DUF4142 domain-containing protein n=1 Tax=Chryseolinea lacunae TaxID=2801331 RepID=A0ABS1KLG8_9BACT|nr:DUF4142 domain-containing protein [Chryseolinea lacunae]MBL0740179.1 DUF4142 domain-containing protein [Chryseolinea lacunae]